MKKALSHPIVGISAASLAQPLNAVENEDELIPTPTPPAKKREFKYTFEVMKMQVSMRIAIKPEDCLVKAVRDQILNVAPYLISSIHNPSDATYLLDRVFRTDSLEDKEIIRQALYTAAGLDLTVQIANPIIPTETVIETQETSVSEALTPTLHTPSNPIEETADAPSVLELPQEPIRVESPIDSAPVNVAPTIDNTSLEAETTISHEVSSMNESRVLDEGLSPPINVTTPNHTSHSLTQEAIQAPGDPIEMTTPVVSQTKEISEVESYEPSHELSISYEGTPETQLEPLKTDRNQPHSTQLPKPEHIEKTINFSIDLEFVSPGFDITHSSSPQETGEWREETTFSKPSLSSDAKNNLTLRDHGKFADTKIAIKSKARLHTKFDEFQLRAPSTPSVLNHLGIGYLAGLMIILMSFIKEAFGLRTRIQIAARPRNHYKVIGLSDLPTWTFNLNSTNGNRKSGLKKFQKKS